MVLNMDEIKIRILLNKGRVGIPLDKLGNIAGETLRFLKLLIRDVGISNAQGDWIAKNFENSSLAYDSAYVGNYQQEQRDKFNLGMMYVSSFGQDIKPSNGFVSNETILQYAKIANHIDPDEIIEFGLYNNGAVTPQEWKELTKESANKVIQLVQTYVEYYGSIYGTIHALFKGASPQYFNLRDSLSGELVKCTFDRSYYPDVIKALKNQNSIIYAFGRITSNIVSKTIDGMAVSSIKIAPELSEDDYKAFFGCAPNIKTKTLYGK
jgi:hypothetical protein